jgi:hypothetical protein
MGRSALLADDDVDLAVLPGASLALPRLRSGLELYNTRAGELRVLADNFLGDGLTLFAGRQKSGKSWLILQIAIALAGGPAVDGLELQETGAVLVGALEEPAARTAARLRKLAGRGDWLKNVTFFYDLLPLMGGGAEQLRELIQQTKARVVFLDTLTAAIKASGKHSADVFRSQYAEVDTLRKIAEETRTAFVVVHHLRKGGGDGLEAIAGTGGIAAAVDAVWILRRLPEGESTIEVVGREVEEHTLGLHFENNEPFGWKFTGDGNALSMSVERRDLLDVLREEGGLTPAKIAVEMAKSRPAVRMLLKRAANDGAVYKRNGSYFVSSSLSMSDRSYRESEGREGR